MTCKEKAIECFEQGMDAYQAWTHIHLSGGSAALSTVKTYYTDWINRRMLEGTGSLKPEKKPEKKKKPQRTTASGVVFGKESKFWKN